MLSVLLQASFVGIGAAGMTIVIINRAFDLSVAGMLALCGVVLALLLPDLGILPVVVVALVLGGTLGVINGLVVTKLRIPAFIATLGMYYVYLALAFIITDGQVVGISDKGFRELGTGDVLGLPIPFILMILTYVVAPPADDADDLRTQHPRGRQQRDRRRGGRHPGRPRAHLRLRGPGRLRRAGGRGAHGVPVVGQRDHGPGLRAARHRRCRRRRDQPARRQRDACSARSPVPCSSRSSATP